MAIQDVKCFRKGINPLLARQRLFIYNNMYQDDQFSRNKYNHIYREEHLALLRAFFSIVVL